MQEEFSADENSPPSSPLRIPIFRMVWIANLASNFGSLIQSVGASWMMVSLSGSATYIALVQSSTTLPIMLLALVAGAFADNLDRRIVMLVAQGFMLLVSVTLAVCAALGVLTPWLLLVFTFLIGCGTALNGPAWQASVGDMVPRQGLPSAITLNSMGFNIARSLGPAIGGMIVAAAGAAMAFLVNALSYVGLIVVLLRWRPEVPPRLLPRETLSGAMAAGIRYVAMSPGLRIILMRAMLFGLAASSVPALMPLVARDLIAGGALTYGVLLGAFGVGAVGGALGSGWLRGHFTTEWIVRGSTLAVVIGTAVTGISTMLPLTMIALSFSGAGWVLVLSILSVSVQLSSPRWVVARALAMYQMLAFGGMALGSWAFGAAAEVYGVGLALLGAAALQTISAMVGFIKPMVEAQDQNLDLLGQWTEPETDVPVEARSGPIVVTLEYRIKPDNVIAFLNVMDERRRIRMRDGARHWTLLRDLGEQELWIERYHVPTWLDYVRHNQRRTQADAANSERISELHEGTWPPTVHRMIERQTGSMPTLRGRPATDFSPSLVDPARYS
ncbi:MFS transporter [Rhizorhapis sp. SPR117]|uniref:MFS transporter n=1 Tax=Rhizorhapis sp. SPR117 TaxID=2912611 RepID=UPI001F1D5411|nr:MFS transporter [Rhizorhapis sp. SPR117]